MKIDKCNGNSVERGIIFYLFFKKSYILTNGRMSYKRIHEDNSSAGWRVLVPVPFLSCSRIERQQHTKRGTGASRSYFCIVM